MKLAEALRHRRRCASTTRADVDAGGAGARARTTGTVLIDFRVEQEDSVYPMVPAGADLHKMIRARPVADRRDSRTTRSLSA